MKRPNVTVLIVSALVTFSAVSASYAIAGLGFHWGFDYSLSMDDVPREPGERVDIPSLTLPSEITAVIGMDDVEFFKVARTNWRSSAINFGGKVYIDLIPFIEAVEVSCNFGLWQYDGALGYLDVANITSGVGYKWTDLTIAAQGMPEYVGLNGTPYAKLQLDATVRKKLLDLWIIKISGGAGASAHFATPLLTGKLVGDVLGAADLGDLMDINNLLTPGGKTSKAIVQKIIDEAMGKPVVGMHILLGVKAKLPVMPIGIYVDGKFMIPFTSYDDDAGKKGGVSGYGLLVNAGLSLSI